jgi:hypothetical protein
MPVNSLADLRMFEEAALRRFASLGRSAAVLCRRMDIAYRKPCFAGKSMRVVEQAFEQDGKLGVVAVLVPEEADGTSPAVPERGRNLDGTSPALPERGRNLEDPAAAKPHAYVAMSFDG